MSLRAPREPTFRVGALFLLSTGFVVSALLRAGDVVAELPIGGDDGFGNPVLARPDSGKTGAVQADGGATSQSVAPDMLMSELRHQREVLAERQRKMDAREQKLRVLERHLEKRLSELTAARERLAETAALVDDRAGKDVRRLADMYQAMKPKQAGQIFNEMPPSFAAGFIAEMRADSAALILANMSAEKAYAVSLLVAGRTLDGSLQRSAQDR